MAKNDWKESDFDVIKNVTDGKVVKKNKKGADDKKTTKKPANSGKGSKC